MDRNQPKQSQGINIVTGRKFSEMNAPEKLLHVGKVIAFLVTFGFAFPNIFSE